MQFSQKEVLFTSPEHTQNIQIYNSSPCAFIFKVKCNNLHDFKIWPARGIINPAQTKLISITFKRNKNVHSQLLILHSQVTSEQETPQDSFDTIWKNLNAQNIKQELFDLKGSIQKSMSSDSGSLLERRFDSVADLGTKQVSFKPSESPTYQLNLQKTQSLKQSVDKMKKEPILDEQKSRNIKKPIKEFDRTVSAPLCSMNNSHVSISEAGKVSILERDFQRLKERNSVLESRLAQKDRKISFLQEINQKRINQSFKEEQFKLNQCNLILLAIVLIMSGYFVARHEL